MPCFRGKFKPLSPLFQYNLALFGLTCFNSVANRLLAIEHELRKKALYGGDGLVSSGKDFISKLPVRCGLEPRNTRTTRTDLFNAKD
jgi:hypothetical protein